MRLVVILLVGFAMIAPATAMGAQDRSPCPAVVQYACPVSSSPAGADSRFPFAVLDLALLIAGGGVLLVAGIAVRRLSAGDPYEALEQRPAPLTVSRQPARQPNGQPARPPLSVSHGH